MTEQIAVFPGTFDPITYGHIDVIERGAALFDKLVVGVSENPAKTPLVPIDERLALIRKLTSHLPNVTAEEFHTMTVDFVKSVNSRVILRGIRTYGDFEYEFQLAIANRKMGGIETVFVMASAENSFIRSTLIKEAAAFGADVSSFVPPEVEALLQARMPSQPDKSVGLCGAEPPSVGGNNSALGGETIE